MSIQIDITFLIT